ncbi:hypothetical protein BDV06DRAFT_79297 [Aspergillus oleicola]
MTVYAQHQKTTLPSFNSLLPVSGLLLSLSNRTYLLYIWTRICTTYRPAINLPSAFDLYLLFNQSVAFVFAYDKTKNKNMYGLTQGYDFVSHSETFTSCFIFFSFSQPFTFLGITKGSVWCIYTWCILV